MYHTLFKTNGEIVNLKYKPSLERFHKMLDCEYIDSHCFNFFYNNKEYEDVELIIDDESVTKGKPINRAVSTALSTSIGWRNRAYIISNKSKFVMCGDIVVITTEELILTPQQIQAIQANIVPSYNFIDDHRFDEEDLDSWIKYEKEQKELNAQNITRQTKEHLLPPTNQQKAFPEID